MATSPGTPNVASQSPQRLRAEGNFRAAATRLQETIPKDLCARLGEISFPDFREIDGVCNKVGELEAAWIISWRQGHTYGEGEVVGGKLKT